MRINSAKDDAAGMAIANGMQSTIKGQTVAMRNANDAISFSQTAEGAMSKITDNLQRMRELAVQSANATNSVSDRAALNTEFTQLQAEISRVTDGTVFNGSKVLAGGSQKFQIGAGTTANDSITITGADLTTGHGSDTASVASGGTSSTLVAAAATALAAKVAADLVVTNANTGGNTASSTQTNAATAAAAASTAAAASAVPGYATGADITTAATATSAIDRIDAALKEVNTETIKQGATQNRFAAVISTLQVSTENQTQARSRIMDTDYAAETATLARGQILQQAGMAMLAQANQLPNGVMALMR